jgi:hypothetical protein
VFSYDELEIINALVKFLHLHGVVCDGEIMVVMKIYHNDLHKLYVDLVVTFVEDIFQNFNKFVDWWTQIIIKFQFGMNHTLGHGEIMVVMKIYPMICINCIWILLLLLLTIYLGLSWICGLVETNHH